MTKRKSPRKHRVKQHDRKGRTVREHSRGHGAFKQKMQQRKRPMMFVDKDKGITIRVLTLTPPFILRRPVKVIYIFKDGKRIGYIKTKKKDGTTLEITEMLIDKEHQKKRYGTTALTLAENWWRQTGWKKVFVDDRTMVNKESPTDSFWYKRGYLNPRGLENTVWREKYLLF